MKEWGYELILDVKGCDVEKITSGMYLACWVGDLVDEIGMKAFGEPVIQHFATHDPDKAGYSVVQLIETSNITAHFVDKNGDGYINIFSCREFDENAVAEHINRWLGCKEIDGMLIARGVVHADAA